jgi:hypothetical protein
MGEDKRDIFQEAQNFQAGCAGSIPVTRSIVLRMILVYFSLTQLLQRRFCRCRAITCNSAPGINYKNCRFEKLWLPIKQNAAATAEVLAQFVN